MISVDPSAIRLLFEALIAGFSVLGGGMAYASGSQAADALAEGRPSEIIAHRINEGIARGFRASRELSVITFAVMVMT